MAKPASKSQPKAKPADTVRVSWNGAGRIRIPFGKNEWLELSHGESGDLPSARVAELAEAGIRLDHEGND